MTTEDDFQAALDANPDDHLTRLVFADWLEERDDPRAEGYRALGALRWGLWPNELWGEWWFYWWNYGRCDDDLPDLMNQSEGEGELPQDWFALLPLATYQNTQHKRWRNRRAAEDAAALAFAHLPAERRAELLTVEVVTNV